MNLDSEFIAAESYRPYKPGLTELISRWHTMPVIEYPALKAWCNCNNRWGHAFGYREK